MKLSAGSSLSDPEALPHLGKGKLLPDAQSDHLGAHAREGVEPLVEVRAEARPQEQDVRAGDWVLQVAPVGQRPGPPSPSQVAQQVARNCRQPRAHVAAAPKAHLAPLSKAAGLNLLHKVLGVEAAPPFSPQQPLRVTVEPGVFVLKPTDPCAGADDRGGGLRISGHCLKLLDNHAAERIRFAGAQSDPAPFFRAADLFALSSDTEQMPLALVEAMAAGRPCLSTDVGDVATNLPESQAGGRVPLAPSESVTKRLRAALEGLLDDGGRPGAARTGRGWRSSTPRKVMVERYRALYREAVAAARARS